MLSENKQISSCYSKFERPMLDAPITMRIKFCKVGNLQFISHLDLQRTFHRILVRAGIPMWYTKGFNPHAKLVFGLPLSVGAESVCEFADLKIERQITPDEVISQLNANLTDEMYVLDAYIPSTKFADIAYASYTITINSGKISPSDARGVKELFSAPVNMIKKTKSGEKEVDITQFIKNLDTSVCDNKLVINAVVRAGNVESLNPEYLISAIKERFDFMKDACYGIMRNTVYNSNMEEFK